MKFILHTIVQLTKFLSYGLVIQCMCITLVMAKSHAQQRDLETYKVSLNGPHLTLEEVFERLEEATDFKFTYLPSKVPVDALVSSSLSGNLKAVLQGIANEHKLHIKRINNLIVVKKGIAAKEIEEHIIVNDMELTGMVTDGSNDAIIGATVVVKDTGIGTITDVNGKFRLSVPEGSESLVISFVGFITKVIPINGKSEINVVLEEDIQSLNEIVVIGYGTEVRKNITGAVSTVDPQDIVTQPKANVVEQLDGRLPGVQVMTDNSPGGGVALRIRGFSTINSNDPLIIIDGVPSSNSLNGINPADIESLQVLKDAASASIYGSRAANGVVIITTKQGKNSEDGTKIELNMYAGTQSMVNKPEMLDAQQYGDLLWQATINDGRTPLDDIYGDDPNQAIITEWIDDEQTIPSADVDWLDAISQTAAIQSYDMSISGGSEKGQHLFSLGYYDQQGLLKHTYFKRYSARLNNSYNIGKFLTIGENVTANYKEGVSVGTNAALGSIIISAMDYLPVYPVKDINGNYALNPANSDHNPLDQLYRAKDNKGKTLSVLGNVYADVNFSDFTFKTSLGVDFQNYNNRSYSPSDINSTGSLSTSNNYNRQVSFTNTLNYNKNFGPHSLNLLVGQEAISYYYEGFNASRQNFLYDDSNYRYLDYGSENQSNSGNASEWALNSYFGRILYNFDEKYLVTATVRQDGSSRFSNENKWGTFPAFSLGWRLDRESFFQTGGLLSSALVRGNWGQTGNQDIESFATVDSYRSNNANSNYPLDGAQESVYTGLTQSRISNADLKWETTTQIGVGADLGFLEDKLTISADFYNKKTKDILVYSTVPITYGGTNDGQWVNDGKMKNTGVELNINYADRKGDFGYDVGVNLTHSKNKLTSLTSSDYLGIPSSALHSVNFDQEISRSAVGQPIGSFYGYVAEGLFQTQEEIDTYGMQPNARPGDIKFKDVNEDGEIDDEDRTFIGSPHPNLMLGVNLKFNYKNFDLSMFFNGNFGNDIYNFLRYRGHFFNQSANKSAALLDAWTPENTETDIPRLSLDDPNNNIRPSSYYVENGSYLRLNNLQLGYNVPTEFSDRLHLRVYAQASNLFTITKYSGFNPQVGLQNYSGSNRNLDMGVDRGLYPPNRTLVLGFNLNF